jgi:hypothetical protein
MDLVTPGETEHVLAHVDSLISTVSSKKLLVGGTYHLIDRYYNA